MANQLVKLLGGLIVAGGIAISALPICLRLADSYDSRQAEPVNAGELVGLAVAVGGALVYKTGSEMKS